MRPVSDAFLRTLRGSHKAVFEAYVVAPGQTGTSPAGTEIPITGGFVELDAKAAIRSTLELTTDGDGTFPEAAGDDLAPFGNEIFVRRGVEFGSGAVEWVSLGYFRILSAEQDAAPDGEIRVQGQDRMAGLVEADLTGPVQYSAATSYGTVVEQLVTEVFPTAVIVWDDTTDTDLLGRTLIAERSRFDFLDNLIVSKGKVWYWDHRGYLMIKNVPDPQDVVWECNAGAGGVMTSLSRDLSREGVYNAVVASGEALDTTAPASAVAVDDNPASPTYWDGAFGKVPRFYSSAFITTDLQASTAAAALLQQDLGLPYNVRFGQVPNPALEPHDPIAINPRPTSAPAAPRTFMVETYPVDLVDTWGTTDTGQTWGHSGSLANWDVTGGEGTWAAPTTGDVGAVVALGVDESDVDGYYQVRTPIAVAGGALVMRAEVRYVDASNRYSIGIELTPGAGVAVKAAKYSAGVYTELGANNPIPGLAYVANAWWRVHVRAVGTTLRVRVWPDGDPEPTDWHLSVQDSDHPSGAVGFFLWRVSPNTNTGAQFHFRDVSWKTRPGVSAGAELHVIERLSIPLDVDAEQRGVTRQQTLVVIGDA